MDTYDLSIYQGATFSLSLTVRDSDSVAINLSNSLISGYLKTYYSNTGKLTDLNVQISNASSGIISMSIPASITASLPINYAFYDVEALNTGTLVTTRVLAGKALIYPEVTY